MTQSVLDLRAHTLPSGALPHAPRRPFENYSPGALAAAEALTRDWPEKAGILTHVVRSRYGTTHAMAGENAVIEVHVDAVAIPPALADRLVELGFEPDGFARFVPAHFATHHTLKFKVPRGDIARRRALRAEAERRYATLVSELETRWRDIEAYLEMEVYTSASRRRWPDRALGDGWADTLPYSPGALSSILPPCTAAEAERLGVPLSLAKRADIHLKVARATPATERERLIEALEAIGFYRVLTWAGNDVCTAQFAAGSDARRCFEAFTRYFDCVGGCVELTLEPVARVWRSRTMVAGEWRSGALPPLVMSVDQ